jgi:hypothetical protein
MPSILDRLSQHSFQSNTRPPCAVLREEASVGLISTCARLRLLKVLALRCHICDVLHLRFLPHLCFIVAVNFALRSGVHGRRWANVLIRLPFRFACSRNHSCSFAACLSGVSSSASAYSRAFCSQTFL